jgi:hypothetical protein
MVRIASRDEPGETGRGKGMARSHAGDPVAEDALLDAVKNVRNPAPRPVLVDGPWTKSRPRVAGMDRRPETGRRVHCVEVI